MKFLNLCICIVSINYIYAQNYDNPKKLKVKGTHIHSLTNIEFPEILNIYNRVSVTAFDKKKENIGVTYKYISKNGEETLITLYIYPALDGFEDRLRNEFLVSLHGIVNNSDSEGINFIQTYAFFKDSLNKVNGYTADFNTNGNAKITLFECGEWFFKIRTTSNNLDTSEINKLEKKFINYFKPTLLVRKSNLKSKADVSVSKKAFRDSLTLGCTIASAIERINWSANNIDSTERASGFPDLYLDMHISSWKAFVDFQQEKNYKTSSRITIEFISQLNKIISSGYLEEFIMKEYGMVMIIPENLKLDFEAFENWKKGNPISISLRDNLATVYYKVK